MSWSIGPVTFHLYGLILGVAVLVSMYLGLVICKKLGYSQEEYERHLVVGLVGSLAGARLWHVFTDFSLYQDQLIKVLYVWQGGLSIIGAVLGLVSSIWLWHRLFVSKNRLALNTATFLDVVVFGLPFGQAIGRLGNYVNQELYGLPTQLPWALYIEPQYRSVGYQQFSTFHPLFAYEMLLTLLIGSTFWYLFSSLQIQNNQISRFSFWQLGTGNWFVSYIGLYSAGRFLLDFLRIDKQVVLAGLGTNQLVLLGLVVLCGAYLLKKHSSRQD